MVDLSVIIVNWNAKELLKACIESIYRNAGHILLEIIVVDNASTDGSQGMIKELFPRAVLIENKRNLGYSRANNIGFNYSKGKYLLFLNPDTLVPEKTLEKAFLFMEENKDAGIVGCKHLNSDGSFQPSAFGFIPLASIFAYILGLNKLIKISWLKKLSKTRTVGYVQGSFLLIRREIFQEIGGFDENFFLYGEDVDLCKRVWDLGRKVYYYPDIFIIHYLGGSSRNNPETLKHFISSSLYFYKKHQSEVRYKIKLIVLKSAMMMRKMLCLLKKL
ncbi:MAG: glycosyltransferase family 2 protein [Thermodesulfobacteriota bacterium]